MKKILLISLATAVSVPAFADCSAPASSSDAIQCMVQNFNARKNAVISQSSEIYQYNYNVGYGALSNPVSTIKRIEAAPVYMITYDKTIVPDLNSLYGSLKTKNYAQLQVAFSQYQSDRRALFTNLKTQNFATYLVKEQEQALGSVVKVSGNIAKATAYAKANYIGYVVPATIYELLSFLNNDAGVYLNSAVMNFNQQDCSNAVNQFQYNFADLMKNNGTLSTIMSQAEPNSELRQMLPYLELGKAAAIGPFLTGALNFASAYTEGKVASGNQFVSYDVCDYSVFTSVANDNSNPYVTQLNSIVNNLSAKTHYTPANIYWLLTAGISQGLAQTLTAATINSSSSTLPF